MWPSSLLIRSLLRKADKNVYKIARRHFLSPQFSCKEDWVKRLNTPMFKKIVLEDFYNEIDLKYNQTKKVSALDVDIFTNAVSDESFLDEMHDLVHKLRLTENAIDIFPSTQHGFVRAHLDCEKHEELLTILNDRLNYGIFLDHFTCLMMMNELIVKQNYRDAAKVVGLQMLQEDFTNPLITYMSLYSCHQYLNNPVDWEPSIEPVNNEDDDEEEIKVRVKYIRNSYFDEHFDLKVGNHLIGKSLMMIRCALDTDITSAYDILGAVLFEKYQAAETKLQQLEEKKSSLPSDIIELALQNLTMKLEGADDTRKLVIEKLVSTFKRIPSSSPAFPQVESLLKEEVKKSELKLIQQQKQVYQEWIDYRDKMITEALQKSIRDKRLRDLEEERMELAKKEEELFFFENEDEIDLRIENKKVVYPRKWLGKKKKKRVETSEYVSPDSWRGQ